MSNEVEELKEEILYSAKETGLFLCTTEYNLFVLFQKGEELEQYRKIWPQKLEAIKKEITASKTIKGVFATVDKFDTELLQYIKATKVNTAEKAMEIAHSFIKKYVPVALPLKAEKKGAEWLVDIDVGALAVKVAKVKVDARTGDILSYEIPEKESKETK
jgi:hypothetical protein